MSSINPKQISFQYNIVQSVNEQLILSQLWFYLEGVFGEFVTYGTIFQDLSQIMKSEN